jgi:transcriptional regulator with PAS, ATPase and Fis domain
MRIDETTFVAPRGVFLAAVGIECEEMPRNKENRAQTKVSLALATSLHYGRCRERYLAATVSNVEHQMLVEAFHQSDAPAKQSELIGTSRSMADLKITIGNIARSDSKVLITGESGVGKELVARGIHASGQRAGRPFVAVNCAGLPETLLESELFGHVKGSFTGAYRDKPGKLEIAHQGTVFLDEVGEMTLRMQGLLLRFLETGEIQKVGAERNGAPVDVRVIAATNRNLTELIAQGQFREDLYYRLKVITVHVPPLRDRSTDVPQLVDHFLARLNAGHRYAPRAIAPEAMAALARYTWPGNIREVENVVERLVVTVQHATITIDDLPEEIRRRDEEPAESAGPGTVRNTRAIADELYQRLVRDRQSFWTTVYPLYMQREITKATVRDLVRRGLEEARGNYRIVVRLFNIDAKDYKKFLNFLRKHSCQLPYKEFRCSVQERA